jgi:hypothetical protein
MKTKAIVMTAAAAVAISPPSARAVLGVGDVVSDPVAEEALVQKNVFDQLKYAWEQSQWAEKLATLHSTLDTVRQQLETVNQVKQAIGDPAAAIGLIDSGVFSDYFANSGIDDTLGELAGIVLEGAALSATVRSLFDPIDMSRWKDLSASFEGMASFRDASDPLKRFRAIENAYARFETLIGKAQNKRKELNLQISKLNTQLKGAKSDAEVQKLVGSLATAQTALGDLDSVSESAGREVQMLQTLNQNRKDEEEVASEDISRERNREYAQMAIQAEAEAQLPEGGGSSEPDLLLPNPDQPPGF